MENEWKNCYPLTEELLSEVEKKLGISISKELRDFFLLNNGGKPEKTYYFNDDMEVEIGSAIPISPPKSYKGESFEAIYQSLQKAGFENKLVPFAIDNGNAGVFCQEIDSGEIVYWVHDEPENPISRISKSLSELLSNLSQPPY